MTELSTLPASYDYRTLGSLARKEWNYLRQLAPFLDEQGLLRVGGRLQRAGYSYSQTHPLILPRRHLLTARIVASCHTQNKHVGYGHVLAILRERFWVLGGTATVRHYLLGCVRCRHARAPPGAQQMAPLPASRFKVNLPAFSYAAVDYFGPLTVKVTSRKTDKRWGCLMTCLTSRAVHLDVAGGLSTNQFLMVFRRFIAEYGPPKEMLSDNGTNFTGADKALAASFKQVDFERVASGLRPLGVSFRWRFNPPAASHQGGVFERMIGLTRSCLRRTMKEIAFRPLSPEALLTMLKEIQGVINSRPLIPSAGTNPAEFDVLTPAQLLRPGLGGRPTQVREFSSADALRNAHNASQWHAQEFWRRFQQGYIPLLQKRTAWFSPHRNFAVGDLVLMQEKGTPRGQWPLALITEVFPHSVDNLVRRVKLRFATGNELLRDVRSICLLEAVAENPCPSGLLVPNREPPMTRSRTRRARVAPDL